MSSALSFSMIDIWDGTTRSGVKSSFYSQILTPSIWNSNEVVEWAPPVPTMDVDVSMIDIWDGTTRAGGQKFFYTQRWNVVLLLFYIPGRQNFWDRTESTVYLQQL